jgi:hypothetical protein
MAARIPQPDNDFNTYINATATYLTATNPGFASPNWERLSLTGPEFTAWVNYKNDWNLKYQKVVTQQEQGIRDSAAITEKNDSKKQFTQWATDPKLNKLDRIGASPNCTAQDRQVFNIKERDETRTVPTTPIATELFFDMKPLGGGGSMRFSCRSAHDASRASIPQGANGLEIRYLIGSTAPNSVDDCPAKEIRTEALFTLQLGAANTTQKLFAYGRWIDIKNQARSGPWSDMVQTVIV